MDAFAGTGNGTFRYYENTGSPATPHFAERTGAANPLTAFDVGFASKPAFVDVNADGDLDLLSASRDGAFFFFENTGSPASPAFRHEHPLDVFSVDGHSTPVFADLDADGDLDALSGEGVGRFAYYENTGSPGSPAFAQRTGLANPLDSFDVSYSGYSGVYYGRSHLALGDLDGDGDLDVFTGSGRGDFRFLENLGTPAIPFFVELSGTANPLDGFDVGAHSAPTVVDLDGDGDLDVLSKPSDAPFTPDVDEFHFYENTGSRTAPAYVERIGAANPLAGLGGDDSASLAFADFDGDGDLDAVAGRLSGPFDYFANTGSSPTRPSPGAPAPRTPWPASTPGPTPRLPSPTSTATWTCIGATKAAPSSR
jgi:hypothetical protein